MSHVQCVCRPEELLSSSQKFSVNVLRGIKAFDLRRCSFAEAVDNKSIGLSTFVLAPSAYEAIRVVAQQSYDGDSVEFEVTEDAREAMFLVFLGFVRK